MLWIQAFLKSHRLSADCARVRKPMSHRGSRWCLPEYSQPWSGPNTKLSRAKPFGCCPFPCPDHQQEHDADGCKQHDTERVTLAALSRGFLRRLVAARRNLSDLPQTEPCPQRRKTGSRPNKNCWRCDISEEICEIAGHRNDATNDRKQQSAVRPNNLPSVLSFAFAASYQPCSPQNFRKHLRSSQP